MTNIILFNFQPDNDARLGEPIVQWVRPHGLEPDLANKCPVLAWDEDGDGMSWIPVLLRSAEWLLTL